jgi:hypothetical protein
VTCRIIWVVRIHRVVDIQWAVGIHRIVDVQRAAGIHRIVNIHRVAGIHRVVDIQGAVGIHRIVDIHRVVSIPPVRRTPTTRGLPQVKQSVHDLRQDGHGNQQDYDSHRRNDQLRHGSLRIGRLPRNNGQNDTSNPWEEALKATQNAHRITSLHSDTFAGLR